MNETRILPEKITHPFQLMAAWFVMLLILDTIFLTSAASIHDPTWAPDFLVISSGLFTALVMFLVYRMLTKFRPHLQDSKEYAEWLKDEQRYRGEKKSETKRIKVLPSKKTKSLVTNFQLSAPESKETDGNEIAKKDIISTYIDLTTYPISISYVEGERDILSALRNLGFRADVYEVFVDCERYEDKSKHTAIWVGSRVPSIVAVLAIKTVLPIWPHLKYISITGEDSSPPDEVLNQVYIGGSTNTAKEHGLMPWSADDIKDIPDDISLSHFHKLIRTKYPH